MSSTSGAWTSCAASRSSGDALVIGALTTYTELRRSPLVAEFVPALVEAAATIGAAQIQNRGTLGGNVANASPAGDTLPVLLALGAEIVLGTAAGERTVAADDFWTGYRVTARRADELVVRIRIPLAADREARFRKIGTRRAQAICKVVMALAWRATTDDGRGRESGSRSARWRPPRSAPADAERSWRARADPRNGGCRSRRADGRDPSDR